MWVRNNKGNVFVGNLPPDFSDERLAEVFDPFGIVLSAGVARDPSNGAKLRYGFVDIATERAATKAITALDGSEVDGCKLNVKAREKREPKKPGSGPPRRPAYRAAPSPPPRRETSYEPDAPRHLMAAPTHEAHAAPPRSQSDVAREAADAVEPPPRREFEVVRRPIRRTTTPSFQVERRPLPRRV